MIRIETSTRWWSAIALIASLRLAHINLLWSDEDYHLAAALQLLQGRVPYRDFWYDKPPLAAVFYSLIGAHAGWPLRLLDIAFILACCWLAYRLATVWWSQREGFYAAALLAFYTTFYLAPATIPFAVDALLLLPHLAAIYFAKQKRPLLSGLCCALGLLTNIKAVFIAATCALWLAADWALFSAGLLAPLALAAAAGAALHALPDFYNQVWRWSLLYSKGSIIANPIVTALRRIFDWLAFHAALLAAPFAITRTNTFQLTAWFVLSCASLALGNHFAPRYFFQLLPVLVVASARAIALLIDRYRAKAVITLAALLLISVVRFGPRYVELTAANLEAHQTNWSDAALDTDAQQAANLINAIKQDDDKMFVWGYRPDLYVYTQLTPPGKFWDSQPLDGVPADRHLQSTEPIENPATQSNRAALALTSPRFLIDGLGPLNPALAPDRFPDLAPWLAHYRPIAQTRFSKLYERVK